MIGLDTSVVIRYLVQDEPDQSERASAVIDALTETEQGFLSLVTIVEINWVLRRAYGVTATDCTDLLAGLVEARELRIERSDVVRTAMARIHDGADFADAVIAELGRLAGCDRTLTFDRRAAEVAGMELL